MSEILQLHRFSDNHDIRKEDCADIEALVEEARNIHFDAEHYMRTNNLDCGLFLPGPVWSEFIKSDYLLAWPAHFINISRAISTFSGFHLCLWARGDSPRWFNKEKASVFYADLFGSESKSGKFYDDIFLGDGAGARLDRFLDNEFNVEERMRMSAPIFIEAWESMIKDVPEKYWLSLPPLAGEIGYRHRDRIINPDLIMYQTRVNALYGAGALDRVEKAIGQCGHASYLEIGAGSGAFAFALNQCFGGALRVHLVDLPASLCNGVAYLAVAAGIDNVQLVRPGRGGLEGKSFTMIPNHLLPELGDSLPQFDLVHNAISMNEMTVDQVDYYGRLIKLHLSELGVFHLSQGERYAESHVDALDVMCSIFDTKEIIRGNQINGVHVSEGPNSFFYR